MRPLVIAHRGASGHAPENTLAAFRRATQMGARAVELDVHLTRDGVLAVCHDETLRRTGGDRRALRRLLWREAAAVDVGSWFSPRFAGERVPRLEEVYAALPPETEVHVELKRGSRLYPGIEESVLSLVRGLGAMGRTVFSSFDHDALERLRSLDGRARIGYLLGLTLSSSAFRQMRSISAESLNLSVRQARPRLVRAARARGLRVLVYTVNAPAERDRLLAGGVDGVFSNYPELDLWR